MHQEGAFKAHKNIELFYQSWLPQKEKRASIIIVHGVGEHSSRYAHVGEYFSSLGYAVYAFDQRGNGRSPGKRGHVNDFDEYTLDLKRFIEHLLLAGQLFILGHSLGGLITVRFAMDYPQNLSGIIVSSPALGLSMKIPLWQKALSYALNSLYPSFTMIDNGIPSKYLSHDTKVCSAYDSDPLVHRQRSVRFFMEFVKTLAKTFNEPEKLKCPSLFIQAGDDRIVSVERLKEFFRNIPAEKKILKIYPGFYHEILNEIEKDKVFRDIEVWLTSLA